MVAVLLSKRADVEQMHTLVRTLGLLLAAAGLPFLLTSAILLNQRFSIVRVSWGIFDPQVNGAPVDTVSVIAVSGLVGLTLVAGGLLLARPQRRRLLK